MYCTGLLCWTEWSFEFSTNSGMCNCSTQLLAETGFECVVEKCESHTHQIMVCLLYSGACGAMFTRENAWKRVVFGLGTKRLLLVWNRDGNVKHVNIFCQQWSSWCCVTRHVHCFICCIVFLLCRVAIIRSGYVYLLMCSRGLCLITLSCKWKSNCIDN